MQVNKELKRKVEDYVRNSNLYTFERFIAENRLDEGAINRGFDVLIKCPFHEDDESPSCSVNDKIHAYNCFACNAKGSYIDFITRYEQKRGIRTNYYQKVNDLLRNDAIMQAALGFRTIYVKEDVYASLQDYQKPKVIKGDFTPSNYLELSTWMKKHNCTKEEIIFMVLQMQKGVSASEIYEGLSGEKPASAEQEPLKYDIEKILSFS